MFRFFIFMTICIKKPILPDKQQKGNEITNMIVIFYLTNLV